MQKATRVLVTAALLVAGCASTKGKLGIGGSGGMVDESALGRLPPQQMTEINQQRTLVQAANDDLARSEAATEGAKNGVGIAGSEKKIAKEREGMAQKQLDSAKKSHDEAQVRTAQQQLDSTKPALEAADAHEEAAKAERDAAKARQEVASKEVALEKARLEKAKYQALARVNDPSVQKLKPSDFEKHISEAQADVKKAQIDAQQKEQFARTQAQEWFKARQKLQAASRPGPG